MKKISKIITTFVFGCLIITFCVSATKKSDGGLPVKDTINETIEYYEMMNNNSSKRQVDKEIYEQNLQLNKEYSKNDNRTSEEIVDSIVLSKVREQGDNKGKSTSSTPNLTLHNVTFKMNGNQIVESGSEVDCDSVNVTYQYLANRTLFFYRFNGSGWYTFPNNTFFSDKGYYEFWVSANYGDSYYNFRILPSGNIGEEDEDVPISQLVSTRLISRVEYYENNQQANYSTTSIWDNPTGEYGQNTSLHIMWPSDEATELVSLSNSVKVFEYAEYTDWLGLSYEPESSTIWYSSSNNSFTEVETEIISDTETIPNIEIEGKTIGYNTILPQNVYEDLYTLGTVEKKKYTYYELTLSITVQCNPIYLAIPSADLHLYTTFMYIKTSFIISSEDYWTNILGATAIFLEAADAALEPVSGSLVGVYSLIRFTSLAIDIIIIFVTNIDDEPIYTTIKTVFTSSVTLGI